jgi:hypothetical protein
MLLHELRISLMEYIQNFGACHRNQERTVASESSKELCQTTDPTAAKAFYSVSLEAHYRGDSGL